MNRILVVAVVAIGAQFSAAKASAEATRIAIKNGETLQLTYYYSISNCKSLLKAPITAEILEGPPQLHVSIKEAPVMARAQQCPKPVTGGVTYLTATDVKEIATSKVIVRITFPTKDGNKYRSENYEVTMVP